LGLVCVRGGEYPDPFVRHQYGRGAPQVVREGAAVAEGGGEGRRRKAVRRAMT
jgi:hypothetical protein